MNIFDADFDAGPQADELPAGTELMLGQYEITRYLNSGGFGITYLAKDSLDRPVVIKECFPRSFCRRSNMLVQARAHENNGELRAIVRLFTQEARALSKLQHPFIVGVHQVFEDNNTAYMALDFVDGHDLLSVIEQKVLVLRPDQVIAILKKTLDAIKCVHAGGLLHRDIAPDNIIITNELNPVLIDFGAAREQATKATRALSALRVVKDGYSPQEFYIAGSEQGPFSDLYSLAATFYHLITGELPPDSQVRIAAHVAGNPDPYIPLDLKTSDYGPAFCAAIDKAMAVLPKDRMQSADEWLGDLAKPEKVRRASRLRSRQSSRSRQVSRAEKDKPARKSSRAVRITALMAGGAIAAGGAVVHFEQQDNVMRAFDTGVAQVAALFEPAEQSATTVAITANVETDPTPSPAADVVVAAAATPAPTDVAAASDFLASLEMKEAQAEKLRPVAAEPVAPEVAAPIGDAVLQDVETSFANGQVALDWRADLPVTFAADGTISALREDAPDWLEVGQRLTAVNGVAVRDGDDILRSIREAAVTRDGLTAAIMITAQAPEAEAPVTGTIDAQIVYSAQVADGFTFQTEHAQGTWQTKVVEAPVGADAGDNPSVLRPGDVIVAVMGSEGDLTDGPAIARIFGQKIAQGTERVQVAVNRDGLMWIIDVDMDA